MENINKHTSDDVVRILIGKLTVGWLKMNMDLLNKNKVINVIWKTIERFQNCRAKNLRQKME